MSKSKLDNSRKTTFGKRNAFATSSWVDDAFHDANRGFNFTSTLALSGTDWVKAVASPQASRVVCVAPPDDEKK